MDQEQSNLPAEIAAAIVSVSKGLVPSVLKSLDRLLGAAVDVPVSKLKQVSAKIDAQTEALKLVEKSISQSAARSAGADQDTINRAMNVLVRREYRKQENREQVASVMLRDLAEHQTSGLSDSEILSDIDEDWLNVFERFAEDASSERLQDLWGRVLSGEIRKPGKYSTRTLRFLSEFSQRDALAFEQFAYCAFDTGAPRNLVVQSEGTSDLTQLIYLEANGLIHGVSGNALTRTVTSNSEGMVFLVEDDIAIVFKTEPNSKLNWKVVALTPLGQELLSLVPGRNKQAVAKAVALALRGPEIREAHLGKVLLQDAKMVVQYTETLWGNSVDSNRS